jgi:CO/xanthine dehydrogenase FAD-binding subunit
VKIAPFSWHGPRTVPEAVEMLAEYGSDGKILAGGQSLLPVLAMRLAEPEHIVDINGVAELDTVTVAPDAVTVGALARHSRVLRDDAVADRQPLLRQALSSVAHPAIRNRGTVVGSLAHADPAGEMTAILVLTRGFVTARSTRGVREIPAVDFFRGPLESALHADEIAVAATFPALPSDAGAAFLEISRRTGDYALCGVGAVARVDRDGSVIELRCGYLAVAETPIALDLTDAWHDGQHAAAARARAELDPESDLHASADYRRHLTGVLTIRAARQAISTARQVRAA